MRRDALVGVGEPQDRRVPEDLAGEVERGRHAAMKAARHAHHWMTGTVGEQLAAAETQHKPLVDAADAARKTLEQAQTQINELQKAVDLVVSQIAEARAKT